MILISMVDQCPQVEPEERFVAVTFPEYVWEFLEKESDETGLTVSVIVGRIVTRHVRDEIGRCG
jgi:hypothetical protein